MRTRTKTNVTRLILLAAGRNCFMQTCAHVGEDMHISTEAVAYIL